MSTTLDMTGLTKRIEQLEAMKTVDASDLMIRWQGIISEDNRRGILQGLDKNGVPMVPVKYRPKQPTKPRTQKQIAQTATRQRLNQRKNARKGVSAGFGPMASGLHNNLTSAEYKLLGGPPLAPRDQFSRVITNLEVGYGGPPKGDPQWFAFGEWADVVSNKGIPFLKYHFHSVPSRLPVRDLRGVRPDGIAKAVDALRNWARLKIRELFA